MDKFVKALKEPGLPVHPLHRYIAENQHNNCPYYSQILMFERSKHLSSYLSLIFIG